MTIEERAEHIAKVIVSGSAIPFYVAGTAEQQARVVREATTLVLAQLQEFKRELLVNKS